MSQELRIGVTCYPTTGGSGIIATEIGLALAQRGHDVHFMCYDVPARLGPSLCSVTFHRVELHEYPLLHLGPYPLALASTMAKVSKAWDLDLLLVHYAIPHATSAYLCKQIMGAGAPKVVTTLHGTDITLVGSDPSLVAVTRLSLLGCDGLTVPSAYLRAAAIDNLGLPVQTPIEVIPNFVDTQRYQPAAPSQAVLRHLFPRLPADAPRPPVLVHSSNFRPVKRIDDAVRILQGVRAERPALLVLVGDGPERPRIEALVKELGLQDAVCFLGMELDFLSVLQQGDVFLLPSETEGFGLAALEALSCGIPVVGARVGGVPEVVAEGETGYLCPVGDVAGMTRAVLHLLRDGEAHARMAQAARRSAVLHWQRDVMMDRYEAYYRRVLGR